jgi:hypothetical protein
MSGVYDVVRYNPLTEVQGWKLTEIIYDKIRSIRLTCPCGHEMRHIKYDNINLYCKDHNIVPEAVLVTYRIIV